jgi:hypothetical protein
VVPASGRPGVFWTHNDSGWDARLFAVDTSGRLVATLQVTGARNRDWEDLAAGRCAPESDRRCLYIADTGDNLQRREDPAIYRVPEPEPVDGATEPADRIPLRLPHGPRDMEALALLADGTALLITKGRGHPVEVYRTEEPIIGWQPTSGDGAQERPEPLGLERIQTLTARPPLLPRMVTGAAATAAGDLVAVRTYETLRFYRPRASGRLEPVPGGWVNLRPLRERQGEAVAFLDGSRLVLTSEAGPGGERGQISVLRCEAFLDGW